MADDATRILWCGLDDVALRVLGLGDVERGERHRAREPYRLIGELEAGADAPAETEAELPRVLLRGLALGSDEAGRVERHRLRVRPRIMQEFPDRAKLVKNLRWRQKVTHQMLAMQIVPFGMKYPS
jgi:hypothetical protein